MAKRGQSSCCTARPKLLKRSHFRPWATPCRQFKPHCTNPRGSRCCARRGSKGSVQPCISWTWVASPPAYANVAAQSGEGHGRRVVAVSSGRCGASGGLAASTVAAVAGGCTASGVVKVVVVFSCGRLNTHPSWGSTTPSASRSANWLQSGQREREDLRPGAGVVATGAALPQELRGRTGFGVRAAQHRDDATVEKEFHTRVVPCG